MTIAFLINTRKFLNDKPIMNNNLLLCDFRIRIYQTIIIPSVTIDE